MSVLVKMFKQDKGVQECRFTILTRVVRIDYKVKVIFEQKLNRYKHVVDPKEEFLGRS